jgi:plastocyanin
MSLHGGCETVGDEDLPPPGAGVVIKSSYFDPAVRTIYAGMFVTWMNRTSSIHTVTFDDGFFSCEIKPDSSCSYRFYSKGTFNYHCLNHPDVKGTIIVK